MNNNESLDLVPDSRSQLVDRSSWENISNPIPYAFHLSPFTFHQTYTLFQLIKC